MREAADPSWFARWEERLPSPEELMPLSQSLITPDLALAFDIPTLPSSSSIAAAASDHHLSPPAGAATLLRCGGSGHYLQSSSLPAASASDFEPSDLNSASAAAGGAGSGGGGTDEPARTLKRPRLVWTPQLHKRFVDAVAHLGIKNAVPKTIMQLMSVDGLTRENVASHLQKYRLYLKRMQGLGGGAASAGATGAVDAATDQLFASAPVPHHFLNQGPVSGTGGSPEPFLPFGQVAAALQHHQQQQMTAALQQQQHHQQQQYYNQRQLGRHFDSLMSSGGGAFEHGFLSMGIPQPRMHQTLGAARGMGLVQPALPSLAAASFVDELESTRRGGAGGGGASERTVLTLFPAGED